MNQSDSFDNHAVPERHELPVETEFLSGDGHCIGGSDVPEVAPFTLWQEHLLPIACVAQEDNLTVLRVELETAHQLLQHQQNVIDSLTQQLTNQGLHLQHSQNELAIVQQAYEGHTANMLEVEAVCRDLKTQLRRQQQRVLQYRSLLGGQVPASASLHEGFAKGESMVAFGCESTSTEEGLLPLALKPSPVSAWSAPKSIGLTGPLARYRKLANIRMAPAYLRFDTANDPQLTVYDFAGVSHQTEVREATPSSEVCRVDLPTFTRSETIQTIH